MPTVPICARCSRSLDEPLEATAATRLPCPVCGSVRRTWTTSLFPTPMDAARLGSQRPLAGDSVPADGTPDADRLRQLFRASLQWYRAEDGRWLVRVLNANGATLDGGLGETAGLALDEVVGRLLPSLSAA